MTSYYTKTYTSVPIMCGSVESRYLELFDRESWESFDEDGLRAYIKHGSSTLARRIRAVGLDTTPVSSRERRELLFMLESLLYAHALLRNGATDEEIEP